jgi:dephospho-CoA kinase
MRLHCEILPELEGRIRYLESRNTVRHISSTTVKSFVSHGADVSGMVPLFVKQALEERICGQYRVAVTGGIAVGKSWVSGQLAKHAAERYGLPTMHLNFDELIRELYEERSRGADLVRRRLAELFGPEVLTDDGTGVRREALSARIFAPSCDQRTRREVHRLTAPHVWRKFRERTVGFRGILVVEWAQVAEMGLAGMTNNNVIVVDSPNREVLAALRKIPPGKLANVRAHQWSAERKRDALQTRIERCGHGEVLVHQNRFDDPAGMDALVDGLKEMYPDLAAYERKEGMRCESTDTKSSGRSRKARSAARSSQGTSRSMN